MDYKKFMHGIIVKQPPWIAGNVNKCYIERITAAKSISKWDFYFQ